MEGPKSRPSFSPASPAPREAPPLPGGIESPTGADTPLTRRLRGWDRSSDASAVPSSLEPRDSPIGQGESPIRGLDQMGVVSLSSIDPDALAAATEIETKSGARRLSVAGEAEVRDPRIRHLADDAALSDDEDADTRVPQPPVNGVSPDTSFQVSDPAWDALWTAMTFNGASVGLTPAQCAHSLRDPQVRDSLLNAVAAGLRARGFSGERPVPDRVMAEVAHHVTRALLQHTTLGGDEPSPLPAEDDVPSFDDLERRLNALSAQVTQEAPGDRKSDGKG